MAAGIAAIGGLYRQVIVAANVTLGASSNFARGRELVRVGKRKAGAAVIKDAVGPRGDGMACGASGSAGGEICGDVVGHIAAESLGAVPSRLVTAQAVGGAERVIVIDVAGNTGSGRGRHVSADESEAGGSVIEGRDVGPGDGVVASGAIGSGEGGACG